MKFVHPALNETLSFDENNPLYIRIENRDIYFEIVQSLLDCQKGLEENRFIFSDMNPINISKNVEILTDPFVMNLSSKKIQNEILNKLSSEAVNEWHFLETQELLSAIERYVINIISTLDHDLEYTSNLRISSVFKMMELDLVCPENFLDQLNEFICIHEKLLRKNIFILVGFKQFLRQNEWDMLLQSHSLKKISFILIDYFPESGIEVTENSLIVDSDACIIQI